MFDDKDRQAWQSISSPDTLREKVYQSMSSEEKSNSNRIKLTAFSLIAASFVIVVFSLFLMRVPDTVHVSLLDGTEVSTKTPVPDNPVTAFYNLERTVQTDSVTLVLDLDEETLLSVDSGTFTVTTEDTEIFVGTDYKIRGKITLVWTYPIYEESAELILRAKGKKTEYEIKLSYDTTAATRTLECVRK